MPVQFNRGITQPYATLELLAKQAVEGFINAGCYILPKNVFDDYRLPESFSFETDYLPRALKNGSIMACPCDGLFIDIGIPKDYSKAQQLLANRHG